MAKISFDFDSTLSQPAMQELAKFFIQEGHEVWIVTARMDKVPWNKDLFKVAESLGIPRERIFFTNGDFKWRFFKKKDFKFHFDDDFMEIQASRTNNCPTTYISVYDTEDVIEQF